MNKKLIGKELKMELEKGYDITRISRWAFHIFSEYGRVLDPSLRDILESIFIMEDDPQFELPFNNLLEIADRLIVEGEKEELFKSVSEIKDVAMELGENWLMCPLCQEAWEEYSKYQVVRCPKCENRLHNPRIKS